MEITVIKKAPGKVMEITSVDNHGTPPYKFKEFIDGELEFIPLTKNGIYIVCNRERDKRKLYPNVPTERAMIRGNVLFTKKRNGQLVSLTKTDIADIREWSEFMNALYVSSAIFGY